MSNLRQINRAQFTFAKRYWASAVVLKVTIFLVGALAIFLATPPHVLPQFLLFLAIASEVLQLKSDGLKRRAEVLLRTLDLWQSFGREISAADRRDIFANASKKLRRQLEPSSPDLYFDNHEATGPKAAVGNLIESAWYTGRQAGAMAAVYGVMITVFLVISIASLVFVARDVGDPQVRERVVRLVTAWLLLIVSLNMLKSIWAYWRMQQRCHKTEMACEQLLYSDVSEPDAMRQWFEYQIARASSPLIPEWLWRIMRTRLDEAWHASKRTSG